jgi:hypothetical protein
MGPQVSGSTIVWTRYDGMDSKNDEIFMATPEPASVSMLFLGGWVLGTRRRRPSLENR